MSDLTPEDREALGECFVGTDGFLTDDLEAVVVRIRDEAAAAAETKAFARGWNDTRSIDIPAMDAERERANHAEAATAALAEQVEAVLDEWADYESGDGPRPAGDNLQADIRAVLPDRADRKDGGA